MNTPLILLTNDDGIHSSGLWAAAAALDALGEVLVVAPQEQQSGAGRSMPLSSTGRIQRIQEGVNGRLWTAYSVHATPAQAIQHALLEIASRPVNLVVSGINYGENVGCGVTVSGTVGAALEGASFGIPSLAVSLQTEIEQHINLDSSVDFSTAAYFTGMFARRLLETDLPKDVHVLKVEVPADATPQTPWQMTHLSRIRYFVPIKPNRERWEDAVRIGYTFRDAEDLDAGSDAKALNDGLVAVTPLSLDLTSRVDGDALRQLLAGE